MLIFCIINYFVIAGYFYNAGRCAMAMDALSVFHELLVILAGICPHMVVNRVQSWRSGFQQL